MGARNDGMRNVCELLINVVIVDRPKMLTGLDQKVRGMAWDSLVLSYTNYDSSGE